MLHYSAVGYYVVTIFSLILLTVMCNIQSSYVSDRAQFIRDERKRSVGYNVGLNDNEIAVNKVVHCMKLREYSQGLRNISNFLPSQHFFQVRDRIKLSPLFQVIQQMPKGASLHSHDTALVSEDWVLKLIFSEPNLYGRVRKDGRLQFQFFNHTNDIQWRTIKVLKQEIKHFESYVKSQISIVRNNPMQYYKSRRAVWVTFLNTFDTLNGLLTYRPIFQRYFYQALQELYDDNVQYLEFRGVLPNVYELNGTVYDKVGTVQLYHDVAKDFKTQHPDFIGVKLIYAPTRSAVGLNASECLYTTQQIRKAFPDFVLGFDMVGPEDWGFPLEQFIETIERMKRLDPTIQFFFHAGETNWDGTSTDNNLIDAVLLNSTRIGHAYAILKHPKVAQEVRNRGIALELCPISNQVLRLVDDIRNHPGSALLADAYPVVVCCDDPGLWGAKGLSFDWYMAFLGMANMEDDLRLLKMLAINSFKYSGMSSEAKLMAATQWKMRWMQFIESFNFTCDHLQPAI